MLDAIIIGAGISGASLAFELSKYKGRVLLLDKENDVSNGTTKANSAIIHAGYDPKTGTLMAKYNIAGNKMMYQLCKDLDVQCKQIGSFMIAFCDEEVSILKKMYAQGVANGVEHMRILNEAKVHDMEPNLSDKVIAALYAPSTFVINPWELALAYSEIAVQNGVVCNLNEEVIHIEKVGGRFFVTTTKAKYEGSIVINAAGVSCGNIAAMLCTPDYHIQPTKGEYYLLDKNQGELVRHVIFQCPTKEGKGVLITPSVHGNLLVGPSSVPCVEDDFSTTAGALKDIREKALKSVPMIDFKQNIRTFAGIRARRSDHGDFVVGEDKNIAGFYHIAAMQSPGLTAAPAIAKDIVKKIQKKALFIDRNIDAITTRKIVRLKEMSSVERGLYIQQHPAYGKLICRCEMVSEKEIIDALHRTIQSVSLDGIKRRCGSGMGRCQGAFCGVKIQELIAQETHLNMQDVVKDKAHSIIVYGRTKEGK